MGTHLYVCEEGGPMTLGVDGTPPKWATCPVGVQALDCARCEGAQLRGEAPSFSGGTSVAYRCASGHGRTLHLPPGTLAPESAHCPECDGMLLPVAGAGVATPA